jgi:hypothetical protein
LDRCEDASKRLRIRQAIEALVRINSTERRRALGVLTPIRAAAGRGRIALLALTSCRHGNSAPIRTEDSR